MLSSYCKNIKWKLLKLKQKRQKRMCPKNAMIQYLLLLILVEVGINEENNFKEQAIYNGNDIQRKIASLCTDSMEPKLRPQFLSLEYNNVPLLAVKIDEIPQSQKPCYYKPAGIK